jgi:hypothetical protein
MKTRRSSWTGLLACLALSLSPAAAIAQSAKPLLSDEIQAVATERGIAAARLRFDEIFPSQADAWTVDSEGFARMGNEFMQAGDYAAAESVLEMMAATIEASMSAGEMPSGAAMGMTPEQSAAFQETMAAQEAAAAAHTPEDDPVPAATPAWDPGPVRDDLERFFGEYGAPGQGSARRTLFVTRSCDGYLVAGPVWADVSPWFMKSESDNTFTYSDSWTSVRLEFQGESGGTPTAVLHDVEGLPSPAPRLGPLPQGWEKCVPPPERGS